MLKAELEKKVEKLEIMVLEDRKKLNLFKENVKEGIITVLKDGCSDAEDYVADFCEHIGMDIPTKLVTIEVEVPYGSEISNVEDHDCIMLTWSKV